MNINYDIFIEFPSFVEEVSKDADLDTFFSELLLFVRDRLKPLEDEINAEEANENPFKATIIYMLRNDDKFIRFANYSLKLKEKMLSSFSQEDMQFISNKIELINQARNN